MPYALPGSGKKTQSCIVCSAPANILGPDIHNGIAVDCLRCGDFSVSRIAEQDCLPLHDPKRRALASYLIRRLQLRGRAALESRFLELLSQHALPTPMEAADNFLLWMADQADGSPGRHHAINLGDEVIQASIGVIGRDDLQWVVAVLTSDGHLYTDSSQAILQSRLSPKGWLRVEELKLAEVSSRYAFFARKFDNADLDAAFEECLRPAVAQTGFDLRLVTQRAGLVDAIIENEIRRCRFLIADLSDDNPGAYWEAGLAEGLGKPVIYICRAEVGGEAKKTHFDANHRHTVRWDSSSFDQTAKELKAVIRNTLLGEAKQED